MSPWPVSSRHRADLHARLLVGARHLRSLITLVVALGCVAIAVSPITVSRAAASTVPPLLAASSASDPPYVVGASTASGSPWAYIPQLGGWQPLGGATFSAMAIAAVPQGNTDSNTLATPLFIAQYGGELYVRSVSIGWEPLSTSWRCLNNPAANVTLFYPGAVPYLTVACEGTDTALYAASVQVPSTGLPTLPAPTPLGGGLATGPAIAGPSMFFAEASGGRIWTRTWSTGWTATNFYCAGPPAAAMDPFNAYLTWFGCADGNVWTASYIGGQWSAASDQGGSVTGAIGLSVLSTGSPPTISAEGTDGNLWIKSPTNGWPTSPSGGAVEHGTVAAVSLTPGGGDGCATGRSASAVNSTDGKSRFFVGMDQLNMSGDVSGVQATIDQYSPWINRSTTSEFSSEWVMLENATQYVRSAGPMSRVNLQIRRGSPCAPL